MANNFQITQRLKDFLTTRKEQNIETQIAEAEQIVHSIEKIDSRVAFRKVQKQIQRHNDRIRFINILSRTAAILFIPLLVSSIIFLYKLSVLSSSEQLAMQQISNPSGIRSEIFLPDGSKVWLNAESTISYKIPFNTKSRDVQLTGEAFFEIKKDEQRPFHVESGKVKVTVLGTRFNYKAFSEDTMIEVVLAEGKVKLSSSGSPTEKEIILKPGERAVINKVTKQTNITTGNIEKYVGWHEGKLIFDECPLPEVARRLERWFGIEVQVSDPKLSGCQISTTFRNESLHQILALLELASPIKTTLIPATFEETSHTKNKEKVIITSKD